MASKKRMQTPKAPTPQPTSPANIITTDSMLASGFGSRRQTVYFWLVTTFATFLLGTAVLKWHQVLDDPFANRQLLVPVIVGEIIFGLWLLIGAYPRITRYAAILVLLVFAGYNIHQWIHGVAECGCFGLLPVHPSVTLTIDTVFLLGFFLTAPGPAPRHDSRIRIAVNSLSAIVFLASLGLVHFHTGGSTNPTTGQSGAVEIDLQTATEKNERHQAAAQPASPPTEIMVDMGYLEREEERVVYVTIDNPSIHPINVDRIHVECQCTAPVNPLNLVEPARTVQWPVHFKAPNQSALYRKRIILKTSHPDVREMTIIFVARIGLPLEILPLGVEPEGPRAGEPAQADPDGGTGHVTVINHGQSPIRLLYATTNIPDLVVVVPALVLEPGHHAHLPMKRRQTQNQPTRATITIHTNSRLQPSVTNTIEPRPVVDYDHPFHTPSVF
ncbi:MAG: DUF1573 domain-containing protein [Phycisphaeraceae bacterium]|nr:DUF1573 domain-containing protein [Phycisphaeraceae bacterium]